MPLQKVISTTITVTHHVWTLEIEKTPETPLKKLEFNTDKPETSLKKIYFNIITTNDEFNDMNDDKIVYHSENPTNDVESNTNHQNVQQERTNHNSLYPLANSDVWL